MKRRLKKIMVANRGEIACRIIRTVKKLGMESVALVSDADRNSLHATLADELAILPGESATDTYLNVDRIIDLCKKAGVDGLHPGYGFLSENAEFAKRLEEAGIIFIGPTSESIQLMGLKAEARKLAIEAHVPVLPGYEGDDQSEKSLMKEAESIGYPLLVKASAGGGGRGMRVVNEKSALRDAIAGASKDAEIAFGNRHLILEKYLPRAKHIEVQVIGDGSGEVYALGERECSLQRRHQKIIEESPAPLLGEETRSRMLEAACALAKTVNYRGVGTVEFIVDADNLDNFYFLEMNTRLQVEHPVTENVFGLDLVKEQLNVASGGSISHLKDLRPSGHSVEVRIYAEDASSGFTPRSGTVHGVKWPEGEGIRIDEGVREGDSVGVFYDPLLAKLISYGESRDIAISRMQKALGETVLVGVGTNQDYLNWLLDQEEVVKGSMSTCYVESLSWSQQFDRNQRACCLSAMMACLDGKRRHKGKPLSFLNPGWRNNPDGSQNEKIIWEGEEIEFQWKNVGPFAWQLTIENEIHHAHVKKVADSEFTVELEGLVKNVYVAIPSLDEDHDSEIFIHMKGVGSVSLTKVGRFPDKSTQAEKGDYLSPMPGKIQQVLVKEGTKVKAGEKLLVMESMKMENPIDAHTSGTVSRVFVSTGELVETNTKLIHIVEE